MPPLRDYWRGRELSGCSLFLATLCLISIACTSTAPAGKTHAEDPRGAVSLQAFSDQSIQAAHPINLDPALIARVLSGLHVQERQRILQEMLTGSSSATSATSVFSEEQVKFLAPRIANALTTARAGEAVAFLVKSSRKNIGPLEQSVTETTAGSLYVYGLSLYVTLSHYRSAPGQTNQDSLVHRRLPDSSGLSNRTLHFAPSSAQRPDSFLRSMGGVSTERVVAIDYQRLQQTVESERFVQETSPPVERVATPTHEPLPATTVSGAAAQTAETIVQRDAEIRTLKDLVIKKDLELEDLRKDLQSIRKQLDSQIIRQDGRKRRTPPPLKPQQTTP